MSIDDPNFLVELERRTRTPVPFDVDALAELIAEKVFRKLESADDAREAAARPITDCGSCGRSGALEYTSHGDTERKFACRGCGAKWTVEK